MEWPPALPAWAAPQQLFSCEPAGAPPGGVQQQQFAPPQRTPRNEEWTVPFGQTQEKRGTPESSVKTAANQTCVTKYVPRNASII
jgi:hypothetical protein